MLRLRATDPKCRLGVTTAASLTGARTGDSTSVTVSAVGAGGAGTTARGSLLVLYSSIQSVSIPYNIHL